MHRYHRDGSAAYECHARRTSGPPPPAARSARTIDDAVAERLLAALNPEELELALAAADEVTSRATGGRAAELAIERARY